MTELAELIARSRLLRDLCEPLGDDPAWLVGGSVRDAVLGRAIDDVDLAVTAEPERVARTIARAHHANAFPLSERFGAWRVVAMDHSWQADLTPVLGGSIEADLAHRDFTVNAMAVSLRDSVALIDPHGGMRDLEARTLRVVDERCYREDPLRTLRMARLGCELEFDVDSETLRLASAHAPAIARVSPERVFYELRRLISSANPLRGLSLMDEAGLMPEVLPELEALKGVEQNPYHHLDVWGHTFEVLRKLLELEADGAQVFGESGPAIVGELERPLADGLSRGEALRFGALFHDVGKPATRVVNDEGRVLFWGHDEVGARMSIAACKRLRASSALGDYLAAIARHHLRLGFLVHERPLTRRHIYGYMRACEPVEVEVSVISVADRLATAGPKTKPEAVEAHLGVARELMPEALRWREQGPPEPPLRGDELIDELAIEPGPQVGRLLELLREGAYAGEISSREDALALARSALGD